MGELPAPLILVLDDAPLVREQLERLGSRVVCADAVDAAAAVAEHEPDAIVAAGDAFGVLARLRDGDAYGVVPVIVLVGEDERPRLIEALRAGAHDGLVAPYDLEELDARVAAAVRVKRLHDGLRESSERLGLQALTDELTGLANRRHGASALERAVALAVRHGHTLALVRVDVDHFKAVNDTYGHQVGDVVLGEIGRRLAGAVRGGDELARWGGDEFVAILPDTDREGAHRAAERLRASIAAAPIEVADGAAEVTVSVGWAHWSGDTPDDLLARADRSLYQAKDAGRDRVRPELRT